MISSYIVEGFSHLPKCQICTHRFVLALDKLPDCPLLPYPSPWQTLLPTYLTHYRVFYPQIRLLLYIHLVQFKGRSLKKPVYAHTRSRHRKNLPEISLIGDAAESGPHLPIRILPKTLTRTHRKQERSHTPTLWSIIRRQNLIISSLFLK